jgi:hypothetical protein
VHAPAELLLEFSKLGSHTLADRLASHGESPKPVLPTDMFEAQEIERLGFPFSSTFPVLFREPAELDPARLIRVKFQSEFGQSLSQVFQKAIRVRPILESQDGI